MPEGPGGATKLTWQKGTTLAVFVLAAAVALVLGVPALAQEERGSVPGLTLTSENPGELVISWAKPSPDPSDYRISWTPQDQGYPSYTAANTAQRGNAYPKEPARSHTVTGLPEGAGYQVRMRARFDQDGSNPWSGPWAESAITLASAPDPTSTPEPTPQPTAEPTPEPTPQPTAESTPQPTEGPTPQPTEESTPGADGAVEGLTLVSETEGEFTVSWESSSPEPSDYRVSWTLQDQSYPSYNAANTAQRGNAYPKEPARSHTVTGLTEGAEYQVRMRARFDQDGGNPWSGPWTETTITIASAPDPTATPQPTEGATPGAAGAVEGLTLVSETEGELTVSWEPSSPEPSDYQVSWAPVDEEFLSQEDPNEDHRGNAYPGSGETLLNLSGLASGGEYQVRARTRHNTGEHAEEPWNGPWADAAVTLAGPAEPVRALLGTYTMTVSLHSLSHADRYKGFNSGTESGVDAWQVNLPGDRELSVRAVVALDEGGGGPFYVVVSPGSTMEGPALLLVVGEQELPLSQATVMKRPTGYESYVWPAGGQEWDIGEEVELRLYHLTGEGPVTLPRMNRPGRVTGVRLTATGRGELAATWTEPTQWGKAESYQVYLQREGRDWADAEGRMRVYEPSGEEGERLRMVYAELESGVRYRTVVHARNLVGLGYDGVSEWVRAPAEAPAMLSSLTLTGVADLDFTPEESRYQAQVESGVTETVVAVGAKEAGATTEVIGVRGEGETLVNDAGRRVVLSDSGDTAALVRVTSADGLRQYMYGAILGQEDYSGSSSLGGVNRYPLDLVLNRAPAETGGRSSGRLSNSDALRPRLATLTIGYGEDTTRVFSSPGAYVNLTVPPGISQITVSGTATRGGRLHVVQGDDAPDLPGHQVNLRDANPNGASETAIAIAVRRYNRHSYSYMNLYFVRITRPVLTATDASLSSLAVADATIDPGFTSEGTAYTTTVNANVSVVTLDLETGDDAATVSVSPADANPDADGWQIPVAVGANTVAITVTAGDISTTRTYTLTVTRNSLEMESPQLASLSVAGATLYPVFNEDTLSYAVVVGQDQAQATIAAASETEGSQVTIDPTDQDTALEGHQVDLEAGRNTIAITVTATDGTTVREYELTVFRTPAAANTAGFLQVDAGWVNACGLRVDHTIACHISSSHRGMQDHIPEGVHHRVSVKRWVACALSPDGYQMCWRRGGPVAERTGVLVDDYDLTAEYGGDICVLDEDRNIQCPYVTLSTVEGPFKAIGQTRRGVCAIRSDDTVDCWQHRLISGDWPLELMNMPTEYENTTFKFIAGGYNQACGIRMDDGNVLCWKWDYDVHGFATNSATYPLATPEGEYTFIDAANQGRNCGVKSDGTVECWHDHHGVLKPWYTNAPGKADIGYRTVSTEWGITCGLRKDGQMKCWWASGTQTSISNDSPWRDNAQLLGIDLSGVGVSPQFDRNVLDYTATVATDVKSVTVKPSLTNSLAYYAIYSDTGGAAGDDGVVSLTGDVTVINIRVVSADRTVSNTYTVTVSKSDSALSG